MFIGFGEGELFRRKVPFRHPRLSWPRSDRRAAVCKSFAAACGKHFLRQTFGFFLLLHHPTRTGGVALIFAGSRRHSHSDTSGENKYLVQWSEVKVSLTSAPRFPLGRLLLTGRLRSPNQVSAYRKISLSYQEQPAGRGYARMEAKTDVSTQVWWFEVKKQTEVTITESSRDEAFGALPSCCIDFSHLCFSWDFFRRIFRNFACW